MGSDRRGPQPVIIDANLLYPFQLRNLLVQFGVDKVISPRWTARINAEWVRRLVSAGRVPEARLSLTVDLMNKALPDAEVPGWEEQMGGLMLPDPNDRHVPAAALAGGAKTILTMNLRDFPASALAPHGVEALHPDSFLCRLHDADPALLHASAQAAHANLSRSTPSFADYVVSLQRQGLEQFAERLRS